MDCIICLTETKEKSLSKCKCKYNIHKKCYIKFLESSMFLCPICRKPKSKIKNNYNEIDFIVKIFFTIYFIFIFIIYSLLIYVNYKVFNKYIIRNIYFI